MTISVSLVILTWNRWDSVSRSLTANLNSAYYPIKEIIHVDNGSEDGFCDQFTDTFLPAKQVRHWENQGVAVGYNTGLALASGSHVVITGCDRVMPDGWLATWVDHLEAIPETGVIASYSYAAVERMRGGPVWHKGKEIQKAIPVEARIHSKDFLFKVGFMREDFGLYGYEDAEWSDRAEKYARENGYLNYIVAGQPWCKELPDSDFGSVGDKTYRQYKDEIHADPRRKALFKRCHQLGSPHYNPFARVEPNLLDVKDTKE